MALTPPRETWRDCRGRGASCGLRGTGGPASPRPRFVSVASTRLLFPLTELLRPSQRSRPDRKLPYHCGCTAQAETPATPARENMVLPAPLKVAQSGLTARAQPTSPAPSHLASSPVSLPAA